jgi:hypothetical protein
MYREADVEPLALPSRDTVLLTFIGLLDAGFLFRSIRWSLDSPDGRNASKSKYGQCDMPDHEAPSLTSCVFS